MNQTLVIPGPTPPHLTLKIIQLGGTWNSKSQSWILDPDTRQELEEFLSPPVLPGIPDAQERSLTLAQYMGRIVITGDSTGLEDLFISLGGHWVPEYYGWSFSTNQKESLENLIGYHQPKGGFFRIPKPLPESYSDRFRLDQEFDDDSYYLYEAISPKMGPIKVCHVSGANQNCAQENLSPL